LQWRVAKPNVRAPTKRQAAGCPSAESRQHSICPTPGFQIRPIRYITPAAMEDLSRTFSPGAFQQVVLISPTSRRIGNPGGRRTAVIDLYQGRRTIAAVMSIDCCVPDQSGDHPMVHERLLILVGSLQNLANSCVRRVSKPLLIPLGEAGSRDRHCDAKRLQIH